MKTFILFSCSALSLLPVAASHGSPDPRQRLKSMPGSKAGRAITQFQSHLFNKIEQHKTTLLSTPKRHLNFPVTRKLKDKFQAPDIKAAMEALEAYIQRPIWNKTCYTFI